MVVASNRHWDEPLCHRLPQRRAHATPVESTSLGAWLYFYVLSGLSACLAAIIYVAHLGQAKSRRQGIWVTTLRAITRGSTGRRL
jgi:hypothetical protein